MSDTPIQEIVKLVKVFLDDFLKENSDTVSRYQTGPKLDEFVPSSESLLASLWRPANTNFVPCTNDADVENGFIQKTFPFLLLSGLEPIGAAKDDDAATELLSQQNAYHHTHKLQHDGPVFLYGTSGAGKTRTIFEYLSRNKGLYFLAGSDFVNNPGSNDLFYALSSVSLDEVKIENDSENKSDNSINTGKDKKNRKKIRNVLSMAVYIRWAVHDKIERDVLGRKMSAYEWLLYQLFPNKFLGEGRSGRDIFRATLGQLLLADIHTYMSTDLWSGRTKEDKEWSVFVDEAQSLLNAGEQNFLSINGSQYRSFFSAVMEGLSYMRLAQEDVFYPVFSGTGLKLDQFKAEATSITVKNLQINGDPADLVFSRFEVLDTDGVQTYLTKFLSMSDIHKDVILHVCNWLRGRPRWVASFIEVYVSRRPRQVFPAQAGIKANTCDAYLMEALSRYLAVITTAGKDRNGNRRHSWVREEKSAHYLFKRLLKEVLDSSDDALLSHRMMEELRQAVGKFAVGHVPHVFVNLEAKILIENGISTVVGTDMRGSFDEPIIVEAGINYFELENYLLDKLTNQESGGLGQAFEKLIIPGLMMKEKDFHTMIDSHFEHDKTNAEALKQFHAPTKSAYGVLCVDTGTDIKKTLDWLIKSMAATFEGQVAPFCCPDTSIGPDVLSLLRNADYSDFRACILQSKYTVETDQKKALLTLVSDLLYHQKRGTDTEELSKKLSASDREMWFKIKDGFISDERPCLRIYVHTTNNNAAKSGMVASNTTTPKSQSRKEKNQWQIVLNNKRKSDVFSSHACRTIEALKKLKGGKTG